jgi:carbamoylphosphate synthase small subunit
LFLSFLASLVVAPHVILRHEAAKHHTRWCHEQGIQRLIGERIQVGASVDAVKAWLQREGIDFTYSEDTRVLTARIRKNRSLDSEAMRIEFPVFIQFHFDSGLNLRNYSAVTENRRTMYREMRLLFMKGEGQ